MKYLALLLILALLTSPIAAQTPEATSLVSVETTALVSLEAAFSTKTHNFWQETDILFWQTLPFMVLWGHFLDRQMSQYMDPGSDPHWNFILSFAGVISLGNAMIHAREVINNEGTGQGF